MKWKIPELNLCVCVQFRLHELFGTCFCFLAVYKSSVSLGVQCTHDICSSGTDFIKFLDLFPETLKEIKILHSWKLRFMNMWKFLG